MTVQGRPQIVVLGMMGRLRVGGGVWQTLHYLIGLERLGYDVYYVEAHGSLQWAFQDREADAAAFVGSVLERFDMGGRWAFHARNGSGTYYGMDERQVRRLYDSAELILNLHGGTVPLPEQSASGRLVYLDTDPVTVQLDIQRESSFALDVLSQHCALFTFGENYGAPDCGLPVSDRFPFKPTRQPVVLDFWDSRNTPTVDAFTTVGNWKQLRRIVEIEGEEYYWSKHLEFLKVLSLPRHTSQPLELALSGCGDEDRALLSEHGWAVRDAFDFSQDMWAYRQYVTQSRGEFTVAKDQNVRLRTGWFSDRSATYLAAGRPVVTQETGFSNIFPAGEGLLPFSSLDEAASAIEAINSDYARHRRAAERIAREYFSSDIVLGELLDEVGVRRISRTRKRAATLTGPMDTDRSLSPSPVINIVGDLQSHTGMSATAEGYARALESIGARVRRIDPSKDTAPATADDGLEINLLCSEIAAHFSVRSRLGEQFFRNRYNIGVWLWESPTFPEKWYDRFAYYDEIWAPTDFIASALSPISPVPVIRMPFVLQPRIAGSRAEGRRRLEMNDEEFLCLFVFNFHSRYQRKNPMAAIEAFKRSFRPDEPARLVIKCANASFSDTHFQALRREAAGHRISIIDGVWGEQAMADLTAACDCYVSLHRAEGVGLTISDAMAEGKPVIATGWSGNMDFMNVSNSFPVRYRLFELEENVAHYGAGDTWAEPSIEHAAETMRYVFENRDDAVRRGNVAREDIRAVYSAEPVGARMSRRLKVIATRREFQSLKESVGGEPGNLEDFASAYSDLGGYVPVRQLRYEQLKSTLRDMVRARVPGDATVVVVSKGDDELLNVEPCRAWHFPEADCQYAGYYPKDSAEAIDQLEAVRSRGGDFLLFPSTAFWWLDHYEGFRDHLFTRYKVAHRDESCVMFELKLDAERGAFEEKVSLL